MPRDCDRITYNDSVVKEFRCGACAGLDTPEDLLRKDYPSDKFQSHIQGHIGNVQTWPATCVYYGCTHAVSSNTEMHYHLRDAHHPTLLLSGTGTKGQKRKRNELKNEPCTTDPTLLGLAEGEETDVTNTSDTIEDTWDSSYSVQEDLKDEHATPASTFKFSLDVLDPQLRTAPSNHGQPHVAPFDPWGSMHQKTEVGKDPHVISSSGSSQVSSVFSRRPSLASKASTPISTADPVADGADSQRTERNSTEQISKAVEDLHLDRACDKLPPCFPPIPTRAPVAEAPHEWQLAYSGLDPEEGYADLSVASAEPEIDEEGHLVDDILAKAGKWYLVKWKDWGHEYNEWRLAQDIDERLVRQYDQHHQRNQFGTLIKRRVQKGKTQFLMRWRHRKPAEDTWLDEEEVHPTLIRDLEQRELDQRPGKRRKKTKKSY
jgi:hypothetical protein